MLFLRPGVALFLIISPALIAGCSSRAVDGPPHSLSGQPQRYYDDRTDYRPLRIEPNRAPQSRPPARYRSQAAGCAGEPIERRPQSGIVVVERGDNLCRIAKRYQTTVQAIVDENRLSSPIISVGARLKLPSHEYYAESPFGRLKAR